VYTVLLAWKSPNIRLYTGHIYGSGQPYTCVLDHEALFNHFTHLSPCAVRTGSAFSADLPKQLHKAVTLAAPLSAVEEVEAVAGAGKTRTAVLQVCTCVCVCVCVCGCFSSNWRSIRCGRGWEDTNSCAAVCVVCVVCVCVCLCVSMCVCVCVYGTECWPGQCGLGY